MFKSFRRTDWYPLILLMIVMATNNSYAWTWWLWAIVAVFGAVGLFAGLADTITPGVELRWIIATSFGVALSALSHMWGWRASPGWHFGLAVAAIAMLGLVVISAWPRRAENSLR